MSKLIELTDLNSENFVELLRDSDILMYENIQGSKIYFNCDDDLKITIKSRSLNSDHINKIDLALQKYYNKAFDYLESLDDNVKKLLNSEWWFCCHYFYDEKPAHAQYDSMPVNRLMLNGIVKGNRHTFDLYEIIEYSSLLQIDYQPILFKGILTEQQLEMINYFLNTSSGDLEYVFGDDNFSSFFYKILNPSLKNSVLMKNGDFQENMDKIIIRIDGEDEINLALLNPLYKKYDKKENEHIDTYSILLVDFLEFLQTINIERTFLKSNNGDALYLEIMSNLFNNYCEEREGKITNFNFIIPPFFYEDKFKINIDLIKNTQTRYLIEKDEKLEYMFKIILNSFRHRQKSPIGVFNDSTMAMFNRMVGRINTHIDKLLRIEREDSLKTNKLLDFEHYYDIQYPKDAEDKVYPDLYKELGDEIQGGGKKKKGYYKKKKGSDSGISF